MGNRMLTDHKERLTGATIGPAVLRGCQRTTREGSPIRRVGRRRTLHDNGFRAITFDGFLEFG